MTFLESLNGLRADRSVLLKSLLSSYRQLEWCPATSTAPAFFSDMMKCLSRATTAASKFTGAKFIPLDTMHSCKLNRFNIPPQQMFVKGSFHHDGVQHINTLCDMCNSQPAGHGFKFQYNAMIDSKPQFDVAFVTIGNRFRKKAGASPAMAVHNADVGRQKKSIVTMQL